jgi:hypothetical protein
MGGLDWEGKQHVYSRAESTYRSWLEDQRRKDNSKYTGIDGRLTIK